MRNFKGSACVALAALAMSSALGQIVKTKAGYLFRVHFVAGEVMHLVSTTSVANQGSDSAHITVVAPMTLKVLAIVQKFATVQINIGAGMAGGKVLTAAQSMRVKLDDHNRSQGSGGAPSSTIPLPINPMKPGAHWEAILPFRDTQGQVQRVDGDYRFQGVQVVDGHSVAVVNFSLKGFATGTGTMKLLTSDGSMYQNETFISLSNGGDVARVHTLVKRKL